MTLIKKLSARLYLIYSLVIAGGIALDQLTKWLAVKFLLPVGTVPIIRDALHLTYAENRGAAFGMLANHRWVFLLTSTITIIGVGLYLYFGHASDSVLTGVSLSMILSGGIGNMIDRLALGYVVDFIDFRLINFAIFNGADSFVCVGAALLCLGMSIEVYREAKAEKAKKLATPQNESDDAR